MHMALITSYQLKTQFRGIWNISYAQANSNPLGRLCVGSGEGEVVIYDDTFNAGKMLGIQVGAGTEVEDTDSMSLSKRFTQGLWEFNRCVFPPDTTKTWKDVCSDGTNLYVLNETDNKIHKLNIYTGAEVLSYACAFATTYCICYDATNDQLWAGAGGASDKIYNMNKNTGTSTVNWAFAEPYAMCWDTVNAFICVKNTTTTAVYRWTAAGVGQANIVDPHGVTNGGLGFDGTNLFSLNSAFQIVEFNLAGVEQNRWPGFSYPSPRGFHYDGGDWWVGDANYKTMRRYQQVASGMQITGTELVDFTIAGADATFVLRCFATNKSGGVLTINEIGINCHPWALQLARDKLAAGVALNDGQIARVTYTVKITV